MYTLFNAHLSVEGLINDNPDEDEGEGESGEGSSESGEEEDEEAEGEGKGDGEKKRKRKRRGQCACNVWWSIHDCTSVDDQLDEDDLELIKENIGVDIQAVSPYS